MKKLQAYSIPRVKGLGLYHHIKWVNRAVSTNSYRFIINHVLVEGSRIIGADGRRLHYYENDYLKDDIEDGIYRVVKTPKEILLIAAPDAGTFPDYRKAFPDGHAEEVSLQCIIGKTPQDKAANIIYQMGQQAQGFLFLPYVIDACSDGEHMINVECRGKLSPVIFKTEDRLALIMPLRTD